MSHPWINLFYSSSLLCGIHSPLALVHLSGLIYIPLHVCSPLQLCFLRAPKPPYLATYLVPCVRLFPLSETPFSYFVNSFLYKFRCHLFLEAFSISPSTVFFWPPVNHLFIVIESQVLTCLPETISSLKTKIVSYFFSYSLPPTAQQRA